MPPLNSFVDSIPEALSIFINQIVYDKKRKGERVYTFSLGEAYFDIPGFDISDEEMMEGYHYGSSLGQPELRKKIAGYYRKEYGAEVNPDSEIIISAGSKPVIFMLLMAVLSRGDEVLYLEPAWLSYKEQIKMLGCRYTAIPYGVDITKWETYITDRTKVIIVNNPNNPSGKILSWDEMDCLFQIAKERGIFILSDEAYSDFLTEEETFISFARMDSTKENTLVVNSLSKNMGMSGWRVGYAIANKEVIKACLKLNQHLITCAPVILQNYMAKHFDEILAATLPQARAMAQKRKDVQKILDKTGIRAAAGAGTFYFLLDVSEFPGETEELVFDLLLNHNIATVSGGAYGDSTRKYIRFGIGAESLEHIERCLAVIKEHLNMNVHDSGDIRAQIQKYLMK